MSTQTMSAQPGQGPSRLGSVLVLLTSLAGLGISGYLTLLKFRMLYTPCLSARGGCNVGGLTCEDALGSTWSMLMGLPISVWGAAFYVATAVLALGLLRRPGFLAGAAPGLLLRLAIFDVLVSVGYAVYAFGVLGSPCPFCISLYVISGLLLGGAVLLRRGHPSRAEGTALTRLRQASVLDAAFMAAVVFVVAAGVQGVAVISAVAMFLTSFANGFTGFLIGGLAFGLRRTSRDAGSGLEWRSPAAPASGTWSARWIW